MIEGDVEIFLARVAIPGHSWGASETVALARAIGKDSARIIRPRGCLNGPRLSPFFTNPYADSADKVSGVCNA